MKKYIRKIVIILLLLFVIINSNSFAVKLVLDPGHGGIDTGAISAGGVYERDINLTVARYLKDYLSQYNDATVILTHNGDITNKLEIVDRGMCALNNDADMFISLHFNASTNTSVTGAEVYVTRCTTFDKYNKDSTTLGNLILNNLNSYLGIKNNGVKTRLCNDTELKYQYSDGGQADYYGVIRYAMKGDAEDWGIPIDSGEGVPTVLIEHCYMSSSDTQYFDSDEDLRKIAKADADAIAQFYGLTIDDPTKVKVVSLDKSVDNIAIDDTIPLNFSVLPATAINKNVTYVSSNPEIISVDENGNMTGKTIGQATITITSEDGGKTADFVANVTEVNVESDKSEINLLSGATAQLTPTVTPTSLSNKVVTYSSSDSNIATVDSNGIVTGLSAGTATITITTEMRSKTDEVTVNVADSQNYSVNISNRNVQNDVVSKINERTSVESIVSDISASDNLDLIIQNSKGESISGSAYITTGSKVIFKDSRSGNTVSEYYFVVTGDVSKDGKISPSDYVLIKNHIMGGNQLTGLALQAGDVKKDSIISAGDYVLIKNHIMNTNTIVPN